MGNVGSDWAGVLQSSSVSGEYDLYCIVHVCFMCCMAMNVCEHGPHTWCICAECGNCAGPEGSVGERSQISQLRIRVPMWANSAHLISNMRGGFF